MATLESEAIPRMAKILRAVDLARFDAIFTIAVLVRRGRSTHTKGVAATGTFRVVDAPTFPETEFFAKGRTFDVILRHGNVSYDDDAAMDIRGAALRFIPREGASRPLHLATPAMDLLMNTGELSFSSAHTFLEFALASGRPSGEDGPVNVKALEAFLRSSDEYRKQFEAGLRRAPSSFNRLRYHSQLAFRFHANDGKMRYARFRLMPGDDAPEEGIPSAADLATSWIQDRHIGEARDFGYLRDELKARVAKGHARYTLAMQTYEPNGELAPAMLDPGVAWDEATFPFQVIGHFELDTTLRAKRTEALAYNVAHLPAAFSLLPCRSLSDFGSVGFVRAHVYTVTQRVRRVLRSAKGLGELRHQKKKRTFRSKKHMTLGDDEKRRDSSLLDLVFGHVWRG
jgi:catalase